jgi:AraC-like DNA-binding protein
MSANSLIVKNMVCHRCILAVENILRKASIEFQKVVAGEIHFAEATSEEQCNFLNVELTAIGLELIDNKAGGIIEKIKYLVLKKARNEVDDKQRKANISTYLSQHLYHEYTYLSSLFSSVEGRTIENYFISQRIEKVKELLVYDEMTLSAISFEMEYSSTAHLSNQFKQITGITPSHFKKAGSIKRNLVDHI